MPAGGFAARGFLLPQTEAGADKVSVDGEFNGVKYMWVDFER